MQSPYLLLFVLFGAIRPGSSIECYNCTNIQSSSKAESVIIGGLHTAGCSNLALDTTINLRACPNEDDVCVYLYATAATGKLKNDTLSSILGVDTVTIEVRDCINVGAPENGCFEGVDDKEAVELLQKHVNVEAEDFKDGKTCFCDSDGCDANVCTGISIMGACVAIWLLGTVIGVIVGIVISICCCACVCCGKRKRPPEPDIPQQQGMGYASQIDETGSYTSRSRSPRAGTPDDGY